MILLNAICMAAQFSSIHLHELQPVEQVQNEIIWECEESAPFNELIVSWNGARPTKEPLTIYVSLLQNEWSPWLKYAEWGAEGQRTFRSNPENTFAETFQDGAYPKTGTCDGFRIKAEGSLQELDSMVACTALLTDHSIEASPNLPYVLLNDYPRQSQMVLNHPRHKDLCSPTSTTNAVNYLLKGNLVDPTFFAAKIHDDEFDIYGNWILNTAEASHLLKGRYRCHVERMAGFSSLHEKLMQGLPVVVSVKGTLPGAPQPYKAGHLISVIGYDPIQEVVFCVDPAFVGNESTFCAYPLKDFLAAWGTRYNLAYVFTVN